MSGGSVPLYIPQDGSPCLMCETSGESHFSLYTNTPLLSQISYEFLPAVQTFACCFVESSSLPLLATSRTFRHTTETRRVPGKTELPVTCLFCIPYKLVTMNGPIHYRPLVTVCLTQSAGSLDQISSFNILTT